MFGTYLVVIDGPDKHQVFEVEFNEDLSVEYTCLDSKTISIKAEESNRSYPPHAHIFKVVNANGVMVQTDYSTIVGLDWSLVESKRYEELFAAIINYVDNHSIIFIETKDEAEEFIRANCPR